jgi:hypothetical protein
MCGTFDDDDLQSAGSPAAPCERYTGRYFSVSTAQLRNSGTGAGFASRRRNVKKSISRSLGGPSARSNHMTAAL